MKRCVSPIDLGRCSNLSVGTSKFCVDHSSQFKHLYLKYKQLEKNLDVPTETPEQGLKLYARLKKAYSLRVIYRKKAFVVEAWDRGHDLRMSYILHKMNECESLLETMFQKIMIDSRLKTDLVNTEDPQGDSLENPQEQIEFLRVKVDIKKVRKEEEDFDLLLKKSIKEKISNTKLIYEKSVNLDRNLQVNLGVEYLKDFFLFRLLCRSIYLKEYIVKNKFISKRKRSKGIQVYYSTTIEVDLYLMRSYLREVITTDFQLPQSGASGDSVTQSGARKQLIKIHKVYSKIKNKRKIEFRWMKRFNVKLGKMDQEKFAMMYTDNIRIFFLNSDENLYIDVFQVVSPQGNLRGNKAILDYILKAGKDKKALGQRTVVKERLKNTSDASDIELNVGIDHDINTFNIETFSYLRKNPYVQIIVYHTGNLFSACLAKSAGVFTEDSIIFKCKINNYKQGEDVKLIWCIIFNMMSESKLFETKNVDYDYIKDYMKKLGEYTSEEDFIEFFGPEKIIHF